MKLAVMLQLKYCCRLRGTSAEMILNNWQQT